MPKFQITDAESGQVMTVEGDQAPSQQEAEELFKPFKTGPQLKQEPTGIIPTIKREASKLFGSQTGTYLEPDKPSGMLSRFSQAASESPLDKVLPDKEITKDDSVPMALGKEGYNMVTGLAKFATSLKGASIAVGGELLGASAEAGAFEKFAGSSEQATQRLANIARAQAVRKYGHAVEAYFSADMALGAAEGAVDLYKNHKNMTWGQTAASLEGIVGSAAFAAWLGKKGFSPMSAKAQADRPSGTPTVKPANPEGQPPEQSQTPPVVQPEKTPQQIDERLAEIAEMRKNGSLGEGKTREEVRLLEAKAKLAQKPAEPAPAPEQTLDQARVEHENLQGYLRELADGGASDADLEKVRQKISDIQSKWGSKLNEDDSTFKMSDEATELIKKHSPGVQIVTEDDVEPEQPFGKGRSHPIDEHAPAWADVNKGRVVINRKPFQEWLDSIPANRRDAAVKSLMSEEQIHLATKLEDASTFWKSLTGFERWSLKQKYDPHNRHTDYDDTAWGMEAIRYRMQQIMRITPTEIAQEYGKMEGYSPALRRTKIQALDAIEGIVRRAREKFSDDTTKVITDRMLENIQTAKNALSGSVVTTQPAPFSDRASKESQALKAQADHYRRMGLENEAKELEDMAAHADEWSKTDVEPQGSGRQKPDPNQSTFEDLMSTTRFSSMRAAIMDDRRRDQTVKEAQAKLFKLAQKESGQRPTFEARGAGRGRPKKTGVQYKEGEEMFPKAAIISRPLMDQVKLPSGDITLVKGKAVDIKAGEAPKDLPTVGSEGHEIPENLMPKLPTGVEIESAAKKWVSDQLDQAIEKAGTKGGGLPDIEDFEKYMGRNFRVQPGQARQFYESALMEKLTKASGDELQAMLKQSFGPESILGRMRVPNPGESKASGTKEHQLGLSIEVPLQGWLPPKKTVSDKVGPEGPEERAKGRPELTVAEATQQRRQKVIATIFNKAMGVSRSADPVLVARKEIIPSEIRTGVGFGNGGVEKLSEQDVHDPELESRLYENSRRSSNDKASVTRRILVLRRKSDNSIHQVSVWRNPATERTFVTNPDLPKGEGVQLKDMTRRYGLVETYSLDQPVEKFHRRFASLKDYSEKFGNEADEISQSASAYDPMQVPISEFIEGTEPEGTAGVEEGGIGYAMGPHKEEITAGLGVGGGSMERALSGDRITTAEAQAVADTLKDIPSPEGVRSKLAALKKENFDRVRAAWHHAQSKVQRAKEKLAEVEGKFSTAPEDVQTIKEVPDVRLARKALREAQEEALARSSDYRHESAFRSGVAKIARRFQSLYGKRTAIEHDQAGREFQTKEDVPTETLLNSLAKSLFSATLKGGVRLDPLTGIKSLGGFKDRPSPWDKTVQPSGRELTMIDRRPPTDVQKENLPSYYQTPEKSPAPPDAMVAAPPHPIETLSGEDFREIEQSMITPMRKLEASQNIVRFTPEEMKEIEEEASKARAAKAEFAAEQARLKEELRKNPRKETLKLEEPARAVDYGTTIPAPEPGRPSPRQGSLPMASGRGRYLHETVRDAKDYASMIGMSWLERGPVKQFIAAGFDAYHTMAHNMAKRKGQGVRIQATENGRENKEALGAAIAMHAADPFKKQFIYDDAAMAEYHKMEADNPDIKLAHLLLTVDPMSIKKEMFRLIDQDPRSDRVPKYKQIISDINNYIGRDVAVRNEKGQTTGWREPIENAKNAMMNIRLEGARIQREAERRIENDLLKRGWITHKGAGYGWDDSMKYKLDNFLKMLEMAQIKAQKMLENGAIWQRRTAKAWLKDISDHRANIEYAKAHWNDPQLRAVTERASREMDAQYDREIENGSTLDYNDAYLPGRYDGQYYNNFSVVFGPQVAGRKYSSGKKYQNYYEASADSEGGVNIAATHDISNLVEHRVRQGMVNIGRDNWHHELYGIQDPVSGHRAFAEAKSIPGKGGWKPELKANESERDYVAVSADASHRPIFAMKGSYERLIKSLISPSAIDQHIAGRVAVQVSQMLKHVALGGDFFHLSRLTWYGGSLMGRKGLNFWKGANHLPGWAALDIEERDIPQAVKSGVLGEEDAKWLTEKLPFRSSGFSSTISRMDAARQFERVGFNVGQISDAIYADLVHGIPVLGKYNQWLFGKFTRGLMMRSALSEYERIQKLEPKRDSDKIMRQVGHDLNNYFGSIGKQGWVKSSTYQDLLRVMFLSPQWAEGILKKDMAIPYKGVTALGNEGPAGLWKLMTGHETIARGIARGMVGMFVLTQVINMITRRQPTWQNGEGHQWDADIGEDVWINPLSVFNEMTHELIRYGEGKQKFWDAIRQIGENKLGFIGRAALVGVTDTTPTGEYQTTTAGVVKSSAEQLIPTPATAGPAFIGAASALSGGRINPPKPSDYVRSGAALAGIKANADPTLDSKLETMARKFVKKNKLASDPETHQVTDEPSYAKLRRELTLGNEGQAHQVLAGLRESGKTEAQILTAMRRWVNTGYTGSRRNDVLWLRSLTPEELEMYRQAVAGRQQLYKKWLSFFLSQRQANAKP
jgi:hypothetical protein